MSDVIRVDYSFMLLTRACKPYLADMEIQSAVRDFIIADLAEQGVAVRNIFFNDHSVLVAISTDGSKAPLAIVHSLQRASSGFVRTSGLYGAKSNRSFWESDVYICSGPLDERLAHDFQNAHHPTRGVLKEDFPDALILAVKAFYSEILQSPRFTWNFVPTVMLKHMFQSWYVQFGHSRYSSVSRIISDISTNMMNNLLLLVLSNNSSWVKVDKNTNCHSKKANIVADGFSEKFAPLYEVSGGFTPVPRMAGSGVARRDTYL